MNEDETTGKRTGSRGSSPPNFPAEELRDDRPRTGTRKAREEQRWTSWQAAYRLRRLNTFLGIKGRAVQGKS